jgi:glycosyltransferase involved in cell wall biosynthesis
VSTHERAQLLRRVLSGLAVQDRPADEVVVVDSSRSDASERLVRSFAAERPELSIRYVRSMRRALPWNRWLGFSSTTGDIVLFLDDDVRLAPSAIAVLERAYSTLAASDVGAIAGIGFLFTWDDGQPLVRDTGELRERWLGTARRAAGTMGPGGIPVTPAGLLSDDPLPVAHFWGGAMSYPRDVLARIGYLDRLIALYEQGIGRAEDIVLSSCARAFGDLFLITRPLALHPRGDLTESTPYARRGWRMGVTNTWGRAHTLRWAATDRRAHRADAARVLSLELLRCGWHVVRRPWKGAAWARLAGSCFGSALTVLHWRRLPYAPRSPDAAPPPIDASSLVASAHAPVIAERG